MINHENQVIFIHVPKCAGNSVISFFKDENPANHNNWRQVRDNNAPFWDIYTKFTIVRNPIDLVVDCYKFWASLGDVDNDNNTHPMPLPERNVRASKFDKLVSNFDEFVDKIEELSQLPWLASHLRPQHTFLCDDFGNIMVDEVLKLETINADWFKLLTKLEMPIAKLPNHNPTPYKGEEIVVDQKHVDKIVSLYRKDFEIFGYEIPAHEIVTVDDIDSLTEEQQDAVYTEYCYVI